MDILPILQQLRSLFQQLTFKVITMVTATPTLNDLERKLNAVPMADWPSLRLQHITTLTTLKWDIEYLLKEINIRANNGVLIGFRDRNRARLFDGIDVINERKIVTNTFNEFVRGITYFTNEPAGTIHNEPVYHRNESCSPRDQKNITCAAAITDEAKRKIMKCYIERLIYDELWLQMLSMQQNTAHLEWLMDTKQAFDTCFPETTVYVSLRLVNRKPDNVAITIEDSSGTTTELYDKVYFMANEQYDTKISCLKIVNSQVIAVKTNTCDTENAWTSVLPPTIPGGGRGRRGINHVSRVLDAIVTSRNATKQKLFKDKRIN